MEPLSKIRSQLRLYVAGKMEYGSFRRWIAEVYADCAKAGESEELSLCREIEWRTADFSEGLLDESVLRQDLASFCEDENTIVVTGQPLAVAGSSFYSWKSSAASTG